MRFTIAAFWPLVVLLFVLSYLWWVQRRTITGLNARHLKLFALIRSATVMLLVLAAIQPVLYRPGQLLSVVYLLDVPKSIPPPAIQSAIQWIEQTNQTGKPDYVRYIPFGSNSV